MLTRPNSRTSSVEYGWQSYVETAREIAQHEGGHPSAILGRMLLAKTLYGISAFEYGLYGLHRQPLSAVRGYRTKKQTTALFLKVNPIVERFKVDDKLLFHRLCEDAGLPTPKLLAMLSSGRSEPVEGVDVFPDLPALIARFGSEEHLDVILKPRTDALSTGVRFVSFRAGQLFDLDGRTIELRSFTEELQRDMRRDDYLVQLFVRPHPQLSALGSGKALGTLRIVTFITNDQAQILYALLRIPSAGNTHDNFRSGATGNLITAVDLATGKLSSAWGRPKQGASRLLEAYDRNPETGAAIRDAQVPDWAAICETAKRAARTIPELPCVGWDIALSAGGIVVIEANSNPGLVGGQICCRMGAELLLRPILAA